MKLKLSVAAAAVATAMLSLSLGGGSARADAIRFVTLGSDGETVFDFGNVAVGTTVTLPFTFFWEDGTDGNYQLLSLLLQNGSNGPFAWQNTLNECQVPDGTCTFNLSFSPTTLGLVSLDISSLNTFGLAYFVGGGFPNVSYNLILEGTGVASVPAPIVGAGLPGMITVLSGVGLLCWRRKRKAAAEAAA